MNLIFAISLYITTLSATDLSRLRTLFYRSAQSQEAATELLELTAAAQSTQHLATGYRGAAEFMMCRYVYSPFTKWSHFSRGKKLLEAALAADPHNIELHYLRYTIQTNIPAFLHYNTSVAADRDMLQSWLHSTTAKESDLYNMIFNYMHPKTKNAVQNP